MEKIDIKSMNMSELADFIMQLGQPKFRASQIFKWLHSGVTDFDLMSDIKKELRERLKELCYIADVNIVKKLVSKITF